MNPNTGFVPPRGSSVQRGSHDTRRIQRVPFDLDNFQYRIIRDAMNEATSGYWIRRAQDFTKVLPREGDYLGRSTPEQREERRQRTLQTIRNCLHRSTLCELTEIEERLILDALAGIYERSAAIRASDLQEGHPAA